MATSITNGQLTLDYPADAFGAAEITVRATDSGGLFIESTLTVDVLPVNDAPRATPPVDISVPYGTAASTIDLFDVFHDPDDADATLVLGVVPMARADMFASWAVDPATGVLTLAYAPGQLGVGQILLRADDPSGRRTETTFLVEVFNTPPTAGTVADVTVSEDAPATTIDLKSYFSDSEDGSAGLLYEVVGNTGPTVAAVSIDSDGLMTLSYLSDAHGEADITVGATDTGGLYAETTFHVTVEPIDDAPTIGYLLDSPDPAIDGGNLTLEAATVGDDSATMDVDVEFYRDADGDGSLDPAVDQYLGTSDGPVDTSGVRRWQVTISTATFGRGAQTYFARAIDAAGLVGDTATAAGSVGLAGILDDGDPGYVEYGAVYDETGQGWTDGTPAGGYGGDWRTCAAGTGENRATWTFTGLPDGPHRVYLTYPADATLATDATFTVHDGPTLLGIFTVDQTQAPVDEMIGGLGWVYLGELPVASGTLIVELTDSASGPVAADAIRVLDPPPTIGSLAANLDVVMQSGQLRLSASDVADSDGTVSQVAFYHDTDDDGALDTGVDTLVGLDTYDGDGWSVWTDMTGLAVDTHRFFATATDNDGLTSTAVSTTAEVIASETGLVAWYPFATDGSDAAGTSHGTLQGDAAVVADAERGSVLDLDGSGDYVSLGNPAGLNITGQITLAAWVRPDSTGGLQNIIVRGHVASPQGEVYLRIANGQYQVGSWNGSAHKTSAAIPAGDVGNWIHVAGVYDGTDWRLYRNGVEIASQAESTGAVSVATGWAIGARATGTERFFDGRIDDARIYDRGLSAAEVYSLGYENSAPVIADLDSPVMLADGAATGQTVAQLSASDLNTGETLSWQITAGDPGGLFSIDTDGTITVVDSATLAADGSDQYDLSVMVTDGGTPTLSDSTTVTLRRVTVPEGLVGHWRLDDAGGTTAADWTGANDGQYIGDVAAATGTLGDAATLDGSGDYVSLGNPAELDIQGRITLSAWIKPEATDGFRNIIVRGHVTDPMGEVYLRINDGQ
ncbi:MAG: hypothetical protein HQ581_00035 [Planctomycetes bacterium]|nr:hypothetical protein [Planctomycetota bacterium]